MPIRGMYVTTTDPCVVHGPACIACVAFLLLEVPVCGMCVKQGLPSLPTPGGSCTLAMHVVVSIDVNLR